MNKKQRLKRAFTITELVIVIAVIAVLAAVLIPTFASVVKSANKSADETYLKNINITLADYTAANGKPASDYPEMMQALAADGLCDPSNPYLLAKKLKEDDVRMVWYPNTDKVQLIDTSRETLLWQTGARGMGNFALVNAVFEGEDEKGLTGAGCYVLCVAGDKSCEAAAQLYYDFYETYHADAKQFAKDAKYTNYLEKMSDKAWANSIVAAIKNAQTGYVNKPEIQDDIKDQIASSNDATIDLTSGSDEDIRAALATLASMSTDSKEKEDLAGKTVTFTGVEGKEVEMKDVVIASIGNSYRKESNVQGGTPETTVSVDFGGLKLKDVNVGKGGFVSSGAAFQKASDSGHAKDGYAFTYGLFGTIIAAPGDEVVIENLEIDGVDMDFTKSTETINGKKVETFADNAGVIAGFVQGNVTFRKITINGKANNAAGKISGYDAIAGVVGRAYGEVDEGTRKTSTLTLDDVHVNDLEITGERRASGFVGFISSKMNVEIKNSELKNVKITAARDSKDSAPAGGGCWATAIADENGGEGGTLKINNVTLDNVSTGVNFKGQKLEDSNTTFDGDTTSVLKLNNYTHIPNANIEDGYKNLLLIHGTNATIQKLIVKNEKTSAANKTYYENSETTVTKGTAVS